VPSMIKSLAASIGKPVESGARHVADQRAALERDRQIELAARPPCADCGTLRGFFTRRRRDIIARPASFALCDYCFARAEPLTEQDRLNRKLAVLRAWRREMRSRR
jgi:hypothetical protein